MRAITAGLFISLDGVVEAPQNWHFPYLNDQMHTEVGAQMLAADTMLLGRNTYEEFAGHWATQGSDVPFADQINGIPKLVASRTLTDVTWQNSGLIDGDVATELRALKSGPGKNIAISGSPTLVRHLLEERDLVRADLARTHDRDAVIARRQWLRVEPRGKAITVPVTDLNWAVGAGQIRR